MMAAVDRFQLENQLCIALYDAYRAMTGAYRTALRPVGLTYSQYAVMLALWERDRTTLRDLGVLLHLDSGTLSPLLQRMERMGLIERSRHPHDERVLEVVLTDAGRALRPQAAAAQQSVEAMTGLNPDALGELRDGLNALARRMRQPITRTDAPGAA